MEKNPVIKGILDGVSRDTGTFDVFRRPGLIALPGGALVAYYEGHAIGEKKNQTLFCRVSKDNGATWSDRHILCSGTDPGALPHNIMMAVDGDGHIHCFWNIWHRQLWHCTSTDGLNWTQPENWTEKLKNAQTSYPWNAFGIGSGHAVRLKNGRILIPTWFTTGGDTHKPSAFANIYSDDNFTTLKIGAMLESGETILNPNEGAVAELENNRVLATIRHDNPLRQRAFVYSEGGTETWSAPVFREDLPDPICHASFQWAQEGILFCNCANADEGALEKKRHGLIQYNWSDDARKNLTLRLSRDNANTFGDGICIAKKGGYSDIAVSADGQTVCCIYETGWGDENCIFPREIGFARIQIKAL